MQIANARIALNHFGSDVLKEDITPAEAQILSEQFNSLVGGEAVTQIALKDGEAQVITYEDETIEVMDGKILRYEQRRKEVSRRERTDRDEMLRLRSKYKDALLAKMFPGKNPTLPKTFEEVGYVLGAAFVKPAAAPEPKRIGQFPPKDDMMFMDDPENKASLVNA